MNNIKIYWIGLLSLLIMCTSCEDVVEIDTDDIREELVIEAWLENEETTQSIFLSMSQPFDQNTLPIGIAGATVNVIKNGLEQIDFVDAGNGFYEWTPNAGSTIGEEGDIFELNIVLNNETYQAVTSLGRVPMIDSLTQDTEGLGPGDSDGIFTEFFARDLVGRGDAYWIKSFKNGSFLNKPEEINVAFDAGFSSGSDLDGLVFIPPIRSSVNPVSDSDEEDVSPWAPGDEFTVEIHSLSLAAFNFLTTAQSQITNGSNGIFSEPVINTVGNIENVTNPDDRVLGMFNVAEVSRLSKVIE